MRLSTARKKQSYILLQNSKCIGFIQTVFYIPKDPAYKTCWPQREVKVSLEQQRLDFGQETDPTPTPLPMCYVIYAILNCVPSVYM